MVTVFGDAVVPRGGALGLACLLDIFAAMGIASGVVRTAMSRLAADDWLQRRRVGRNSFYSLTSKGQASFTEAAARIYGAPSPEWDGRFHMVLPDGGSLQDPLRAALDGAGFGSGVPGMWIAPTTRPVPPQAAVLLHITACMDLAAAQRLAARAWVLEGTAAAYGRFLLAFNPLVDWVGSGKPLSDLDALIARILLVHEYRRVVLRDPLLPPGLLPPGWPGTAARQLCAQAYPALLGASERWLSQAGQAEDGPLPPATGIAGRFVGTPGDP